MKKLFKKLMLNSSKVLITFFIPLFTITVNFGQTTNTKHFDDPVFANFTRPSGVGGNVTVNLWGGGGSGGGGNEFNGSRGGGGGGGYAIISTTMTATIAVISVGGGGIPQTFANGAGMNGSSSSFGSAGIATIAVGGGFAGTILGGNQGGGVGADGKGGFGGSGQINGVGGGGGGSGSNVTDGQSGSSGGAGGSPNGGAGGSNGSDGADGVAPGGGGGGKGHGGATSGWGAAGRVTVTYICAVPTITSSSAAMSTSNSNRLLVGSPAVNADGQTGVFSGTGVIGLSPNYYFSPSLAGTGNHIITYTITDTYGCVNSVAQTINITGVLPIDLLDFKAENFDKSISLNWRTGEEKNVNFFSIERSKNGRDFKEIAKIKIGALSKEYTFSDEKPFYGTNYYRLKMTENDDSAVNFSKTVSVSFSTKGGIKVTPTLANYRITVDLPEKLGEITLNISDISGKVIKSVTTNGLQETVDISDLECGMYLVVVQSGVHKFAERFVKQ